jgi:hypothetical protein
MPVLIEGDNYTLKMNILRDGFWARRCKSFNTSCVIYLKFFSKKAGRKSLISICFL